MFDLLINDLLSFNKTVLLNLMIRFIINLLVVGFLIRFVYYPINKRKKYLFVFLLFNILIFFIASLLSAVEMKTGFAFGLFAIFSIIRYRTKQIPIKEMTFLFISIIIATINSTVTLKIGLIPILCADVIILLLSFIMEKAWIKRMVITDEAEDDTESNSSRKESGSSQFYVEKITIVYDKLDLIGPEKRTELIDDIQARTGLRVVHCEVLGIDLVKNEAQIRISYPGDSSVDP